MMLKRLAQRRNLVVGGCIFAAVILGVACTGVTPAHAASCEVSLSASGDQGVMSSSEWSWMASDGDLAKTPPLGIGQEVLSGSYSGSVLVAGPSSVIAKRGLSSEDVLGFETEQEVESRAPGILTESIAVYSVGAPAAGVTCGSDSLDADGANFTRSAYCEYAEMSGLFMTDALDYHSSGEIRQGDIDVPDSLVMDLSSSGTGHGSLDMGSLSRCGIGNTTALGYVHTTLEKVGVSGTFTINGKMRWGSFLSHTN